MRILILSLLFYYACSISGESQRDEKPSAIVDLATLNGVTSKDRMTRMQVRFVAADGSVFDGPLAWDVSPKAANGVRVCLAVALKTNGWLHASEGHALTIFGHNDTKGKLSPIKEVQISSLGNFPLALVPRVKTSGGVKVVRSADPPGK